MPYIFMKSEMLIQAKTKNRENRSIFMAVCSWLYISFLIFLIIKSLKAYSSLEGMALPFLYVHGTMTP